MKILYFLLVLMWPFAAGQEILQAKEPEVFSSIVGFPIYNRLDATIEAKKLETLQKRLDDKYGPRRLMTIGWQLVEAGFDGYTRTEVVTEAREVVVVYISKEDYETLWGIEPKVLEKQGKTHRLELIIETVEVGQNIAKKVAGFTTQIVERMPVVYK